MHRSQQAGLTDAGHHVGGDDEIVLDRDLDVGVPVFHRHRADAANTTSSIITGEFDSIVMTFASST